MGAIFKLQKSSCVSEAKRIMDIFALKEIDAISKSDISPEEKEKALSEASKSLQSVTSFSVEQNELADGEVDNLCDFVDDCTMDDMIEISVKHMIESGMLKEQNKTEYEAREFMYSFSEFEKMEK